MNLQKLSASLLDDSSAFFDFLQQDEQGFLLLSACLHRLSGLHLAGNAKNRTLMASRLMQIMKRRDIASYRVFQQIIDQGDAGLGDEFVRAMTTNTTDFFREPSHFEHVRTAVRDALFPAGKRPNAAPEIRIWCAAASTGQEAFTLAMAANDARGTHQNLAIKILATDINVEVLNLAAKAHYSDTQVRNIPPTVLAQNFTKLAGPQGRIEYVVKDTLRRLVRFAPFNLFDFPYEFQHPFDLIFCRNVLIYFQKDDAATIVANLAAALRPGGILVLGHSEGGAGRPAGLTTIGAAAFRKGLG